MLWRVLCCLFLMSSPAFAAPKVVVSIKPIHALVAGVMNGVGEPALLVTGAASAHTYSLRPSDAQKLDDASVIFWVGPSFETFLVKPLAAAARKAKAVDLMSASNVRRLAAREGGLFEMIEYKAPTSAAETDGHIWLDPENAKAMVTQILLTLTQLDVSNTQQYQRNAAVMIAAIDNMDRQLNTVLTQVKAQPYIVFHDAYQYFERHYDLLAVGTITVTPDRAPGAARVAAIRKKLLDNGAKCVFAEPQFAPKLMSTLLEGTKVRSGTLDPEGSTLPPGPQLYFNLMAGLTNGLTSCLAPA